MEKENSDTPTTLLHPSVRFRDVSPSPKPVECCNNNLPPSVRFTDVPQSLKYNEGIDSTMRLANMMYRRRPPTPTRRRFELGELDNNEGNTNARSSRYNPEVEREEIALKDELLRIFNREKESMEQHYLIKIQELLRSFKGKKEEWETIVKEEREDLEKQFEQERSEMHQNFAQEIAKMTRCFQEEKSECEKKYTIMLKDRDAEFEREKRDLNDSWKKQIDNIKRQCTAEHEAALNIELKNESEKHKRELESFQNKAATVKYELEQKHVLEKERVEKKYENDINNLENKFQKHLFDTEKKHEEDKIRLNKKFEEEKVVLERDWNRRLETLENALRKETNQRIEVEKTNASEKSNFQALNNMLKEEISRLKEEIDRLRKQPVPLPEVKIIEKPIPVEQPERPYLSRGDLPLSLRDDFDRIINEYKENLKDKFNRDKTAMEEKLENERERLKQKIFMEKEELNKRLSEEKIRMERDMDRSRDDIEKEIERRLRTKQLSDSLVVQQQRFDEVTKRIEEEERKRTEKSIDSNNKKLESLIQDLTRENEGLKAKVDVLEDNNSVLKNLKDEGQQEVERLRNAVQDLKTVVEMKRESDRTRDMSHNTATDYTPFLMTMMQQQQQQQRPSTEDNEPAVTKAHMDALLVERTNLENFRTELEKRDREMRERKTIEDVAKITLDKSQEKYEMVVNEKLRLEDKLRGLESKVGCMQEEFIRIKCENKQPAQPQQPPPVPVSQLQYPPPCLAATHVLPQASIVLKTDTPMNFSINEKTDPNAIPSPQQNNPVSCPFYHPQAGFMYSPGDQTEKIEKLKTAKSRVEQQVSELQAELEDLAMENNTLQKQCRDYQRQMDRLNSSLEREKELSEELKVLAQDEKLMNDRLRKELEKENEKVHHAQTEMEKMKCNLQNEINVLQDKLLQASKTIAVVRQQAADEINVAASLHPPSMIEKSAYAPSTTYARPTTPSAIYASNAAKRRLSFSKTDGLPPIDRTQHQSANTYREIKDAIPRAVDIVKIKSLEEEKLRLQSQLNEAKHSLEHFTGNLNSKIDNLEIKYETNKVQAEDLSNENRNLNEALAAMELEQSNQAKQNYQLYQQKEHLQKLIERLTNINPSQLPPTAGYRLLPPTRSVSEISTKEFLPSRRDNISNNNFQQ